MICPDINLLLYATFSSYGRHAEVKTWWDGVLSGQRPVKIPYVVALGFIRLSTHSKVFVRPLSLDDAISVVDFWVGQPNVELIVPAPGHWERLRKLLMAAGTGANLTTDAHIAAIALEHGMVVHSNDVDFARFSHLKVINPLAS